MVVAVPALVSREGGESKERDAGSTCIKLCDRVTRRRGAAGAERRVLLVRSGTTVRHSVSYLGVRRRAGAAATAGAAASHTQEDGQDPKTCVAVIPFQQISNILYCEE